MIDITGESYSEKPASSVSGNATDIKVPVSNTDSVPSTDDMEVHHHTHHAHDTRNWKSYFWEFLMLFLAVTLGFFVENQREHYIEHLRAREFSKSLIQDLQHDISAIHRHQKTASNFVMLADSIINL